MATEDLIVEPLTMTTFTETINIYAGPSKQHFIVHKTCLVDTSPFFKACPNKQWKKGEELSINLPKDDPPDLSTYINWIFTGRAKHQVVPYITPQVLDGITVAQEEISTKEQQVTIHLLIKIFRFADKILNKQFQDAIYETLEKFTQLRIDATFAVSCAYSSTGSDIQRKLVVSYALAQLDYGKTLIHHHIEKLKEVRATGKFCVYETFQEDIIFAMVGVGRDPVELALYVLKLVERLPVCLPDGRAVQAYYDVQCRLGQFGVTRRYNSAATAHASNS
ncbi:hypothetical protein EJ08DRAFT_694297 [Tothia fuscella]|uniref:BTB domain-containing protein n=1 Tax=Tothia fuscella TaxID=1048955 RepID=A0A9P4NYX5_9PEZI|nr:hypothetical protein EJ08DRAFT_694297 [Tothia fuscella]